MWMCSHCSKSFASSRALKIHEVKQHENATRHVLKCGTCHEEFEHANLLHIHMRVHHNVKMRCPRCKDIFEHPNVLKLHIKAHHSEPVCVACGLKFDHDKLLRLHMEHYHKIGGKGAKQGATTPSGQSSRKAKAMVERKVEGDAESEVKSPAKVEENPASEDHEEMNQLEPEQHLGQVNGSVSSEWEFCDNHKGDDDEEAMSHDSSDSRDDGSTDGETGDGEADKGSDGEVTETCNDSPRRKTSETESSALKMESDSIAGAVKAMEHSLSPSAVERHIVQIQQRRSSVIVTTGSVSPPSVHQNPRESFKRKAEDSEEATQEFTKVSIVVKELSSSWDANSKESPHSPLGSFKGSPAGSYPGSPASSHSEDENGGSELTNHKAGKPATLRCNRCQEEFVSKMEYLHHLISHQKGDVCMAENDLSPESRAIQKLKSSLRIKMEARRRDSFADEVNHGVDMQKRPSPEGLSSGDQTFCDANRTSPPAHREEPSVGLGVPCTLCNKRFPDTREMKAHMESRHKKPQCTECGLQFDHKNLLKIHMNSYHSSLEVLQCYCCGKSFGKRSEFVTHVTSHETTSENAKETRRGHKTLRRISSAPLAGENQRRMCSERQLFREGEQNRNINALVDGNVTEKRGDEMRAAPRSEHLKSRFDDVRTYVERPFPTLGAFRHHKEETVSSQDPEEWLRRGKANFLIGPEARTRIFLPKRHEKFEPQHELVSGHRRVPEELKTLSPTRNKLNGDSVAERLTSSSEGVKHRLSAFTTYERSDRANELAKHILLGRTKRDRDGVPLGRPPPLIPVVHPRLSAAFTRQPGAAVLRAHQPVTRTASANSALRYPRVLPYPSLSTNWSPELDRAVLPSPVRDSPRDIPRDPQELSARESINNITKEALLNSLSLRRRASAPELGTLARPLAEPKRLAVPESSAAIKNLLGDSPQRSENAESPLAASPGRSRQLNEGYQPRRRHPRDFTCHHCGIFFGHKKLLKIHLDCYHGSAQELQCLRCEKNFSSRSEFLEHLMSHEGGDELLAFQRKRLRLDRRSSLPHEGETVIRRELNTNVVKETELKRGKSRQRELEIADLRREFLHPLPGELKQCKDEQPQASPEPNNQGLKRERRITGIKPNFEKNEDDDGANFCFVCGQSFSNGKKLEQHISSHAVVDKDGRYCCSLCHKTFDNHRKLEIHTRSHTGFKPHKCELCGRCFPYYSSYYYHKMTHTEDRPHKCDVCGKGFIQTRYLRSHMKTHKEQKEWASDEEFNVESSPEGVKTGDDTETMTKSPGSGTETKVEAESVDASGQVDLEEHDTARILCSFKQSGSVGMREQNSPLDTRADEVTSEETSCTEDSSSINRTEEPNSPLEASENGDEESADHSQVTGTVASVKKETPLDHDASNESLPKPKKKKYKCKHCEKNFSSYSSLHVHVRIHTGQRPYSCNHCFKKFTHSSGLKRHVRCHTGEKPYPCPACPSAFADRGALKSHIRTHTGERPFVCDLCNKTFTQPSSLRVHKKTVHAHEFFDEK